MRRPAARSSATYAWIALGYEAPIHGTGDGNLREAQADANGSQTAPGSSRTASRSAQWRDASRRIHPLTLPRGASHGRSCGGLCPEDDACRQRQCGNDCTPTALFQRHHFNDIASTPSFCGHRIDAILQGIVAGASCLRQCVIAGVSSRAGWTALHADTRQGHCLWHRRLPCVRQGLQGLRLLASPSSRIP